MNDWAAQELRLLRACWPSLAHAESTNWCKIPNFVVPAGWDKRMVDVAFQVPEALPGQEPYAFWVHGGLTLATGAMPSSYTYPVETPPWSGPWGQFSWNLDPWAPGASPGDGSSMVDFVRSFTARMMELR